MVVPRHARLCWIVVVWFILAQGSPVNPGQQQRNRGYYTPPSARMITPEEATAQYKTANDMRYGVSEVAATGAAGGVQKPATSQPTAQAATATSAERLRSSQSYQPHRLYPTHTPKFQQRVASSERVAGPGVEKAQDEQTMDSYLKSLGISDPSVAALLSESAVDTMANSIEHSMQGHQHQTRHDDLVAAASHVHADENGAASNRGDKKYEEAGQEGNVARKNTLEDSDDEYDDTIHLDKTMSGADDDNEDDEPTFRVEPPDDPINDSPSTQLQEPISEWLEKFWEQRRAYKQAPTHIAAARHQITQQQMAPPSQQHHSLMHHHYGTPDRHHLQGQRGSQINVYGQLHIHMGAPQHRQ